MWSTSTTPVNSCSLPMGSCTATIFGPKVSRKAARHVSKSARSRSSMLQKMMRARPRVGGPVPEALGLDFDAHHGIDHHDGGLDDAQRPDGV